MSDPAPGNASALSSLVTPFLDRVGGPLSALRAVVEQYGYVDNQAILTVADVFNLSRAEVRGIVSFYSDLHTTPRAQHTIQICQAEACQAVGSRELTRRLTARFGVCLRAGSADGRIDFAAEVLNQQLNQASAKNADEIVFGKLAATPHFFYG